VRPVVVHLVRAANGPAPFAAFVDSYRAWPAGCAHDLLVVCKGFAGRTLPRAFQDILGGVAAGAFFVSDRGVDLSAYVAAARAHDHEFFCFLNSFSVLQAPGWLATLHAHAARPGVGAVGATGSWESRATAARGARAPRPRTTHPRRLAGWLRSRAASAVRTSIYDWQYPRFPNPHLRTNAIMLRRVLLLGLKGTAIRTKSDAERFESGRRGLTPQLGARGLQALVVGRDGRGYAPECWPESRTFRSGEQENLLVADNRTREYAQADAPTRQRLASLAWGASR
jgi:hypothetical protein